MFSKLMNLRAAIETSLDVATKRWPGEVTESLGISIYLLIWYLAILFLKFSERYTTQPANKKQRWIPPLNSTDQDNVSIYHEGRIKFSAQSK